MALPEPKTRKEVYLNSIANGDASPLTPVTREEVYLDAISKNSGGGGTNVVANPTLAGTESDLTGLQVGDTKYKVPSGGGGASVLIVTDTSGTLNKTWQEIHDAAPLVYISDGEGYMPLGSVFVDEGDYCANFIEPQPTGNNIYTYVADSADGYPVLST